MRHRWSTSLLASLGVVLLAAACSDPLVPDASVASPGSGTRTPQGPAFGLVGANRSYWESFDFLFNASGTPLSGGWPEHPVTPWRPTDFDVAIHSRDQQTWYQPEPFRAMHGTGCVSFQASDPPYAVYEGDKGSHEVHTYDDLNYRCRNHMMTALKSSGAASIYVTPNAMVDFSGGEASIKWAMSTLRTATQDWIDVWITPWEDNLKLPYDGSLVGVDLQGPPRRAIHVRMAAEPKTRTRFELYYVNNFVEAKMPVATTNGYESILLPVSQRRDTFELRISRFHVKFGIRKIATPNEPAASLTWFDVPLALPWTQGVVQFGHHSVHPTDGRADGVGGTWHWDDFTLTPAVPFTIITPRLREDGTRVRWVDAQTAATPVEFDREAPADAFLRFAAYGSGIQVSFDGGETWSDARKQPAAFDRPDHFRSYWTPIPAGRSSVLFRASPAGQTWFVRDVTIWSLNR